METERTQVWMKKNATSSSQLRSGEMYSTCTRNCCDGYRSTGVSVSSLTRQCAKSENSLSIAITYMRRDELSGSHGVVMVYFLPVKNSPQRSGSLPSLFSRCSVVLFGHPQSPILTQVMMLPSPSLHQNGTVVVYSDDVVVPFQVY